MAIRVPLDRITDSPFQPRQRYDQEALDELAAGIERVGLLQPPPARIVGAGGSLWEPAGSVERDMMLGDYPATQKELEKLIPGPGVRPALRVELACGHRRLRAVRQLGWEAMEVRLRPLSDDDMEDMAYTENANREDITPIEKARFFAACMERRGWTQAQVAEHFDVGRSTVSNKLRLLKLPQRAQEDLEDGRLSQRQAAALIPLYEMSEGERTASSTDWHAAAGAIRRGARDQGWSSDRVAKQVQKLKDQAKRRRERAEDVRAAAEVLPDGWGVSWKKHGYVAERGEECEDGYQITSVQETRREAAEAARDLAAAMEQEEQRVAGEGEAAEGDLGAEDLATRLKEEHGIPASRLRGAEDLRAALRDADAVAAGEHLEDPHDLVETWMSGREEGEDRGPKASHAPAEEPQKPKKAESGGSNLIQAETDAPSGDAFPAEADLGDAEEGRIYDAFRADLLSKLEDVPRWMLLRYLSAAAPTGHNREKGEHLRERVADTMVPRRRYVQQGDPKMTRVNLRDWARGSDLYDWGRRLAPRRGETAGDGAAEEEPAVAAGGGMT